MVTEYPTLPICTDSNAVQPRNTPLDGLALAFNAVTFGRYTVFNAVQSEKAYWCSSPVAFGIDTDKSPVAALQKLCALFGMAPLKFGKLKFSGQAQF